MPEYGVIVVAAGASRRMGEGPPKILRSLRGRTVFEHGVHTLACCPGLRAVVVVTREDLREDLGQRARQILPAEVALEVVEGGAERRDSVAAGLAALAQLEGLGTLPLVLVHDAARPLASAALFERVAAGAEEHGAVVPCVPLTDTVKQLDAEGGLHTLPRASLRAVQTPQGFRTEWLQQAHALPRDTEATDDAMLVEGLGRRVVEVEGERGNTKLTHPEDFEAMERQGETTTREGETMDGSSGERAAARGAVRVGLGRDLHRLEAGGPLRLGGVDIPGELQAVGHSDGDALLHALTDALLGALALGDIGRHFSDLDPAHKGLDSAVMLRHAVDLVAAEGYRPLQVDAVVSLQRPKLAPHATAMRTRVAELLGLAVQDVSVKAKTGEGLGPIGESRAIEVEAVATLVPIGEKP